MALKTLFAALETAILSSMICHTQSLWPGHASLSIAQSSSMSTPGRLMSALKKSKRVLTFVTGNPGKVKEVSAVFLEEN